MTRAEQPVTPSVVRWAISESGYTPDELDNEIGLPAGTVREWARGDDRPSWTQLQDLAGVLKRPIATFFLPEPPVASAPVPSFRTSANSKRKKASPVELRAVREARRLQRVLSWLNEQIDDRRIDLPKRHISKSPENVAAEIRTHLNISADSQNSWANPSIAFDRWRESLERIGVHVFLLPLGGASCKGFSLWDDYAPVVAANTHWNESARIFTLFHELGHLVTRTDSVCLESLHDLHFVRGDAQERWCEEFAASVLLPREALTSFLQRKLRWTAGMKVTSLDAVKTIARHFNVSIRAAAVRLIKLDAAEQKLYSSIPPVSEAKPKGGGGLGRARHQVREDAYGYRTTKVFLGGIEKDLITPYDTMTYLRISDRDLAAWEERRS